MVLDVDAEIVDADSVVGSAAPRLIRPGSHVEVRHEPALRLGKLRAGHRRCRFAVGEPSLRSFALVRVPVADAEHRVSEELGGDGAHEARVGTLHIGLRAFERTVALVIIQGHRASDVGRVVKTPRATPRTGLRGIHTCRQLLPRQRPFRLPGERGRQVCHCANFYLEGKVTLGAFQCASAPSSRGLPSPWAPTRRARRARLW